MSNDDGRPGSDELDDEPLPGLDDPENEPSSGPDDSAPPPAQEGPYATVEEALRIPERSDDDAPAASSDARPEPIETPHCAAGQTDKRIGRPRRARRASKAARRRRQEEHRGMTYEDQVRHADEAIAVPGRNRAADERPVPTRRSPSLVETVPPTSAQCRRRPPSPAPAVV